VKRQFLLLFFIFVIPIEEGFVMSDKSEPIVGLNKIEKIYLLELARNTISELISHHKYPVTTPVSDKVKENFGVFVTLHKDGQLRGCIGYIEGIKPLYKAVMEMAESAAFRDPRFPAVQREEVDDLEIEISVLSPVVKIEDIKRIEVGNTVLSFNEGHINGDSYCLRSLPNGAGTGKNSSLKPATRQDFPGMPGKIRKRRSQFFLRKFLMKRNCIS
jgi:AmmeMemoRadiSam system protein A